MQLGLNFNLRNDEYNVIVIGKENIKFIRNFYVEDISSVNAPPKLTYSNLARSKMFRAFVTLKIFSSSGKLFSYFYSVYLCLKDVEHLSHWKYLAPLWMLVIRSLNFFYVRMILKMGHIDNINIFFFIIRLNTKKNGPKTLPLLSYSKI